MVSVADKNWYVIRSVTGQETKVKQYIMTELTRVGLDKQVEEILVPTEKVIQIRQGKKVQKEKTYFPGYIMIKADISGEILHIIRSITSVLGFLGETKGGEPIPLRKTEVNNILRRTGLQVVMQEYRVFFPAFLKILRTSEQYLKWFPLGGQYFVIAKKE